MDLLLGAVVLGVLLGCFYAAVSVGLSVSFGLLDVPHVAHPAFLVLASYGVYQLNESFGVDQRSVSATYIGKSWRFGEFRIPIRQLVAFAVALALTVLLALYLSKTFMGRAIRAVAQDEEALRLMGANPVRIKQFAFGIATAVLGIAGALLIIVAPVEPTLDRAYIGRTFCVV